MIDWLGRLGPTGKAALLAAIEKAVNEALRYDPGTRAGLAAVADQTLLLRLSQPDWTIAVTANDGRIRLLGHAEQADAELGGELARLLAWLNSHDSLADHKLQVRGSTQLLQNWQAVAQNLEIDWEDWANRWLGDIVGHGGAQAIQKIVTWGEQRRRNVANQLLEFGIEELQLLPNRALFTDFSERNQQLRLAVDRLEARIKQLQSRLSETSA